MKRILFQGDSITDAGRSRDVDFYRGNGYPTLAAAELSFENPNKYEFINRAVSGDKSIDLLARIKVDTIKMKPDIISILIGVNDAWANLDSAGVDCEHYELYYDVMIKQIMSELPDVKIMILEPFLLKGIETQENWDVFRSEVEKRATAAKRIAEKYNLLFVPLQEKFDEAAKIAPTETWLMDGVHPSVAGHELIAREWVRGFKELVKSL